MSKKSNDAFLLKSMRHFMLLSQLSWSKQRIIIIPLGGSDGKESACNEEDPGSIPG